MKNNLEISDACPHSTKFVAHGSLFLGGIPNCLLQKSDPKGRLLQIQVATNPLISPSGGKSLKRLRIQLPIETPDRLSAISSGNQLHGVPCLIHLLRSFFSDKIHISPDSLGLSLLFFPWIHPNSDCGFPGFPRFCRSSRFSGFPSVNLPMDL